jgi:hypothetical protein
MFTAEAQRHGEEEQNGACVPWRLGVSAVKF